MEEQLAKYFSGESTQDEMDKIHSWRNESSDNAKAFIEAKNLWLATDAKPAPNLALLDVITREKKQKTVAFSSNWLKYAAAAIIILGVAFTGYFTSGTSQEGMQRLADGSEIVLHGDSRIESIEINEGIREVTLQGKAYFNIQRDENRPFVVKTNNARVEVLGTSFLINTYKKQTEVSVESGLVALIKPGAKGKPDLSVKLAEGETGTVSNRNKGIIKRNNNNPNYLAWKTKTLVFERSKMSDVVSTLEDVYGIQVEFENSNLNNCNLTAKFKERRAKDAIAIIAKTFNLSYEFKGDKVIIKGKGC